MISIIVAIARHSAIGKGGDLLCHMSADLRRFKATTTGHTVVMGRKTYDSLPKGALPNRRNIVVTRNASFAAERVETAHSLDEALRLADGDAFVIGGAEIYRLALPIADRLYLTEIDAEFPDADTFFPEIDKNEWILVETETHVADDKNPYPYAFTTYDRRR